MKSLHFTQKLNHPMADVLFIMPTQTVCDLPRHHTTYVVSRLTPEQLLAATESAEDGSVIVVYGEWEAYARALRGEIAQYGEDAYPKRDG
jgi:hypothetical protein